MADVFSRNPKNLKVFTYVMVALLVVSLALFIAEVSLSDLEFDAIKACKATSAVTSGLSLFALGPLGLWLAVSQKKQGHVAGLVVGEVIALTLFILALVLKPDSS
jgi:hypothetical protein